MPTNEPRSIRGTARLAKKARKRFLNALRAVMATEEGQLVLLEREHGILARCGTYRSTFDGNAGVMAYAAGRQDVGHELLALMAEASEQLYLEGEARMRALARMDDSERKSSDQAAADAKGDE